MALRIAILLAGALFLFAPQAQAWYTVAPGLVREDPLDEDWFWGNLTWNAGKGGIAWTQEYESEAVAGGGGADEFTSAPTPKALYVNASRMLQVDLLVVDDPATPKTGKREVQLWVNDTFFGGAVSGQAQRSLPKPTAPGFVLDHYRFGAELAYVPKSSVLRLKILYEGGTGGYHYGVGAGQNSTLRIPVFPAEEAFFRMPDVVPRLRPVPPPELTTLLVGAPAESSAAFLLVALPWFGPRRRNAVLLAAAALVCAGISGCLGGSRSLAPDDGAAPSERGPADVVYEDPGDTGLANESVGSIIGQIEDPYGLPVPGAHVYVLATALSGRSDPNGIFAFKHLRPGTYELNIDRDTYESGRLGVPVQANQVSRVTVVLAYDAGLDADERPHRHDYWGTERSKTVVDAPIRDSCASPDCFADNAIYARATDDADHNIIRPGTTDVEVNLTFAPSEVHFNRVGLGVQSNIDPAASSNNNWTLYYPRGPGQSFHVRTTWEMADVGHQLFSTWSFMVFSLSYDQTENDACNFGGDVVIGGIGPYAGPVCEAFIQNAKITIHRGVLPLEPRHPDYWGGSLSLALDKNQTTVSHYNYGTAILGGCYNPLLDPSGLYGVLGSPGQPVPAQTNALRLTVAVGRAMGSSAAERYDWDLWFKTGERQLTAFAPSNPDYRKAAAPTKSGDGRTLTWSLAVAEVEADGLYNKRSAWNLVLVPSDMLAACNERHVQLTDIELVWTLEASRPAA